MKKILMNWNTYKIELDQEYSKGFRESFIVMEKISKLAKSEDHGEAFTLLVEAMEGCSDREVKKFAEILGVKCDL